MELSKTAKGLSSQLAPVIEGALDSIYKTTDAHKARQIKNQLKRVVHLAIAAKEAGLSPEQFQAFLSVLSVDQATVANVRLEFAAAVSSGTETTEGKSFNVALRAGGSIAGFGLEAEGGYTSDNRASYYERSSQNLRIRLDIASVPLAKMDALIESIAARVFEPGVTPSEPSLTEAERNTTLEALESYIPVIRSIFTDSPSEPDTN